MLTAADTVSPMLEAEGSLSGRRYPSPPRKRGSRGSSSVAAALGSRFRGNDDSRRATGQIHNSFYFGGFSSFQGSLTIGIVAISTLTSLPSPFSTRRM